MLEKKQLNEKKLYGMGRLDSNEYMSVIVLQEMREQAIELNIDAVSVT